MGKKVKQRASRKNIILVLVLLVFAVGGLLIWRSNQPRRAPASFDSTNSNQSNTSGSGTTNHKPVTSSTGQGGVTDNDGQVSTNTLPPESKWNVSNDGKITLQLPSNNNTVSPGAPIIGTAKVSEVQFMLIDDSVGLLGQGTLQVVKGRFSGNLQFKPVSKTGRLDVFWPNPSTGAEESLVEIPVNF